ncbi:MAG: response regulator transcription factor [Lachnospiraceae bacterium]|nr:response regulator transcription factor [Lachnospiraceae bacterium]
MEEINYGLILVADDDKDILRIVREYLEQEQYQVMTAEDGEEVLRILQSRKVSLIIMDIMMPKMNGLMATMKVRESSNIPILMLSAKSEADDRVIGLSMGADDYLVKPFYKKELLARVQSLLRRYYQFGSAADGGTSKKVYYDLCLDTERKKFFVRGTEVSLTATEYKILDVMLSRPGKIFSAEEIYEAVWQDTSYAIENTVMIHISRIRAKMELNPKEP